MIRRTISIALFALIPTSVAAQVVIDGGDIEVPEARDRVEDVDAVEVEDDEAGEEAEDRVSNGVTIEGVVDDDESSEGKVTSDAEAPGAEDPPGVGAAQDVPVKWEKVHPAVQNAISELLTGCMSETQQPKANGISGPWEVSQEEVGTLIVTPGEVNYSDEMFRNSFEDASNPEVKAEIAQRRAEFASCISQTTVAIPGRLDAAEVRVSGVVAWFTNRAIFRDAKWTSKPLPRSTVSKN